jgi:hypothetical protein
LVQKRNGRLARSGFSTVPQPSKVKKLKAQKERGLCIPGVAAPDLTHYGFAATEGRGLTMDWARILAYVTGLVNQELLARN